MKAAPEWLNELGEAALMSAFCGEKPPGKEVEELVRRIQLDACAEFINTIRATGGVTELPNGNYAPVADEEWIDLGAAYLNACKNLGIQI